MSTREEIIEERHLEKIDEAYTLLIRKYRKRVEKLGGYESLPELWQDFGPIILKTIHLKSPIQRLLNYTSDFHEFCESYQQDTELFEYKTYFEAMDFAWSVVLKEKEPTQTDKIRILNVLQDGQDIGQKLGLSFIQVYPHSIELADDE